MPSKREPSILTDDHDIASTMGELGEESNDDKVRKQ
jgi:hypothetical protein